MMKPLYVIMYIPFRLAVESFYRKIQIKNKNELTGKKRPVLIAMNHPNAFMDPISFASHFSRQFYFLARGDVFKKGIASALRGVGIIPIFRLSDAGKEGLAKNDKTFEIVKDHMKKKDNVIIFAEGICIQERRLRPAKKGAARMALDTYSETKDPEFIILPVGVNYQNNPAKFRHRQFYLVGEPIKVADYHSIFLENHAKGVSALTQAIYDGMRRTIIHISDPANDLLIEGIEEIYLEEFLEENGKDPDDLEQRHAFTSLLVEKVNQAWNTDRERINQLKLYVYDHMQKLKAKGLRDKLLREKFSGHSALPSLLLRTLAFVLGIPFWLGAVITNYPPYLVSFLGGKKLVKDVEWFAAIAMLIGTFAFTLYYFIQYAVVGFIFRDWRILLAFLPVPFLLGKFALHFSPFRKKLFGSWRFYRLKKNKEETERLFAQRKIIIEQVKTLLK